MSTGVGSEVNGRNAARYQMPPGAVLDVPFDGRVGWFQHSVLTVQNIFAIVGMFLFPAVVGAAAHLKPDQIVMLYGATFMITGLGTVLQSTLGLKLPVVVGPYAGALVGIVASVRSVGLGTAFGSMFIAALIWLILSIPIPRLSLIGSIGGIFRDPIVYGGLVIIAMTDLTTITVVNWIGTPAQPGFGAANWVGGAVAIITITLLIIFARGLLRSSAMLIGIILGTAAFAIFHPINFGVIGQAPWFTLPSVFAFGFGVNPVTVILFLFLIFPLGSIGQYVIVSDWAKVQLSSQRMAWGVFGMMLASALGGVLGGFTLSPYPDNLAIVRSSRIGSRWITATAGAVLVVIGFIPKIDSFFVAIPANVIGAAAVVLFGILLMSGVHAVKQVEWDQLNMIVVGLPFMLGIGGLFVAPTTVAKYPLLLKEFIGQPLFTATILLLILHLFVNKLVRPRMSPSAREEETRQADLEEVATHPPVTSRSTAE